MSPTSRASKTQTITKLTALPDGIAGGALIRARIAGRRQEDGRSWGRFPNLPVHSSSIAMTTRPFSRRRSPARVDVASCRVREISRLGRRFYPLMTLEPIEKKARAGWKTRSTLNSTAEIRVICGYVFSSFGVAQIPTPGVKKPRSTDFSDFHRLGKSAVHNHRKPGRAPGSQLVRNEWARRTTSCCTSGLTSTARKSR